MGSYTWIASPAGVETLLTVRKPADVPPSGKSRRPAPTTTTSVIGR
jgi:hypothetical protein